jgi:hypothetical protein
VIAQSLADRAIALAARPRIEIAPRRIGLTGLNSYFWLATPLHPITATATVPGLDVTAEARPVQYVWRFGDGAEEVSYGPGRPWTRDHPGDIAHLYEARGRYRVSVQAIWQARWHIGDGAWNRLGYFTNSDSRRYRVREIVALLVHPR